MLKKNIFTKNPIVFIPYGIFFLLLYFGWSSSLFTVRFFWEPLEGKILAVENDPYCFTRTITVNWVTTEKDICTPHYYPKVQFSYQGEEITLKALNFSENKEKFEIGAVQKIYYSASQEGLVTSWFWFFEGRSYMIFLVSLAFFSMGAFGFFKRSQWKKMLKEWKTSGRFKEFSCAIILREGSFNHGKKYVRLLFPKLWSTVDSSHLLFNTNAVEDTLRNTFEPSCYLNGESIPVLNIEDYYQSNKIHFYVAVGLLKENRFTLYFDPNNPDRYVVDTNKLVLD